MRSAYWGGWVVGAFSIMSAIAGSNTAFAEKTTALTLTEAVHAAVRQSTRVQAADANVAAAVARHKSRRGLLGPSVTAEAQVAVWNKPVDVSISGSMAMPEAPTVAEGSDAEQVLNYVGDIFAGFGEPLRVRGQVTTQLDVRVVQPLTVQLYQGYAIAGIDRNSTELKASKTRRDVAFDAAVAYIQLKQAAANVEIAQTAVTQVQAQLEKSQSLFSAGVVEKNDVLKVEVALARAERTEIEAEGHQALAQTRLALMLGLSPNAQLKAVDTFNDPSAAISPDYDAAVRRALQRRLELKDAGLQLEIAKGVRQISFWNMVPQLSAMAAYQNLQGQALAMKNSFFIGGVLKWNVWQWGNQYYEYQEAAHKVAQAEAGTASLREAVQLQVKKSLRDLQVAKKTIVVARKEVTQSEEAYRIEQVKFANQASTTTDVLDAQLALTRANLSLNNARFAWHASRVAFARATGDALPLGGVSPTRSQN